jgi:cell division protein FtsX
MSVGTIAIGFLTVGGFLLLSANLQLIVDRWASAAEMSVYLQDDVDAAVRQSLIDEIAGHPRGADANGCGVHRRR